MPLTVPDYFWMCCHRTFVRGKARGRCGAIISSLTTLCEKCDHEKCEECTEWRNQYSKLSGGSTGGAGKEGEHVKFGNIAGDSEHVLKSEVQVRSGRDGGQRVLGEVENR